MIIQYRLSDGKIIAAYRSQTGDSIKVGSVDGCAVAVIQDNPDVFNNPLNFRYDSGRILKAEFFILDISTSAQDSDGDGYPDIPADGNSSCDIFIQKTDANKNAVSGSEEVWVMTSNGKLSAIHGFLQDGKMTVKLKSSLDTVLVTVRTKAKMENLASGILQIQFKPVD